MNNLEIIELVRSKFNIHKYQYEPTYALVRDRATGGKPIRVNIDDISGEFLTEDGDNFFEKHGRFKRFEYFCEELVNKKKRTYKVCYKMHTSTLLLRDTKYLIRGIKEPKVAKTDHIISLTSYNDFGIKNPGIISIYVKM